MRIQTGTAVLIAVFVFVLAIFFGMVFLSHWHRTYFVCAHDPHVPTGNEWLKKVHFPYTAPVEREQRIRGNYSKVSPGMSQTEVIALLGEPDYSDELYGNPAKDCAGYEYEYVLRKPEKLPNLKNDINLLIAFDLSGHANSIYSNINGIEEKPDHPKLQD